MARQSPRSDRQGQALRRRRPDRSPQAADRQAAVGRVWPTIRARPAAVDQYELQLDELEASAATEELRGEMAAARPTTAEGFVRRRPFRQPFPAHLPRQRVVVPSSTSCACCGSARLRKPGKDVTETLEVIPRPVEGDPDGAREIQLPRLQAHLPAPSLFTSPSEAGRAPNSWPGSRSRSRALTNPPTGRPNATCAKACPSAFPPWPSRSAPADTCSSRSSTGSSSTSSQPGACMATIRPPVWRRARPKRLDLRARRPSVRRFRSARGDVSFSRDRKGGHPQAHLADWSGILQADALSGYNVHFSRTRLADLQCALLGAQTPRLLRARDLKPLARRRDQGRPRSCRPSRDRSGPALESAAHVERAVNTPCAEERLAARRERSAASAPS